ncbi:MAG: hypothetical protein R3B40_03470 [Polyangiales bacterium]
MSSIGGGMNVEEDVVNRTIALFTLAVVCGMVTRISGASAQSVNIDTVPIYSLTVEIETCDRSDAGTDNKVYVSLSGSGVPYYALRRPQNERRRGQIDTYDLVGAMNGLYGSAITGFALYKEGTDRWDVCRVAMYVNQLDTPVWEVTGLFQINGHNGFVNLKRWTSSEIRTGAWTAARDSVRNRPRFLSVDALETYFETVQGEVNHTNSRISWGRKDGSEWVSATPRTPTQLHVDADLEWHPNGPLTPEADYDETIGLSCDGQGRAVATLVSWDMVCGGERFINSCWQDFQTSKGWYERALDRVFAGVNAIGGSAACSGIHLDSNGSIYLY